MSTGRNPSWGPRNARRIIAQTLRVLGSATLPSGAWTPGVTFATPGDLAVTLSVAIGDYIDLGRNKLLNFVIVSSAFTHTTASGNLRLTGVPAAAVTLANYSVRGTLIFGGITKAGYTQFAPTISSASSVIQFEASGSGVPAANVTAADVPTGGTLVLAGQINYRTS